ncbi:MAG: putative DNA binding domain-containing protein [Bacilli bacterium]|nr:putative DNA binding domain-containing protein [Bacilli bacterium]
MNLGKETEYLEFKKTTSELKDSMDDLCAILNKHGQGEIIYGVKPNGDVCGQEIGPLTLDDVARFCKEAIKPMIYPEIKEEILDGLHCISLAFKGSERPYSSYGRYYIRVVDRSEELTPDGLKGMMASTDYSSKWENNLTAYGIEALDHEALLRFYKKAIESGRLEPMDKYDEAELLSGLGLFANGRFNNAGYYLFSAKKPVTLKMATYVTDERIEFSDLKRIEDNIYNLINTSLSYIKEKMNWKVQVGDDASRVEIPDVPVEAIREIVVNAFAHADYRGITEHEIAITPTQIEIYNPGEFPINLSPESFVKEKRKSQPRNKIILDTLFKSKEVEVFGSGFRKVYSYCSAHNAEFSYELTSDGFSFIFYRKNNVTTNVTTNVTIRLTGTDLKVFSLLNENPFYKREQMASKLSLTVRTIQRSLSKLVEAGKIRRKDSNKTGYWEVIS